MPRLVAVLSLAVTMLVPSGSGASAATMLGTHLHTYQHSMQGCSGDPGSRFLYNDGIGYAMLTSNGEKLAVNLTLKNVRPGATYTITVHQCDSSYAPTTSVTATARGTGSAKFSVTREPGAPVYLTLTNKSAAADTYWSDTRNP